MTNCMALSGTAVVLLVDSVNVDSYSYDTMKASNHNIKIETIWDHYRSALKAFLHKKIANADDVDDLLQDILIKTHQSLHTIKSTDRIKPWLFKIAHHTVIDFYRKRSKRQQVTPEDYWQQDIDDNFQKELASCLAPFISALPAESADLLMQIDLEGESQKDYAEKTGLSYSTLKSRVQKSRSQLRKLFDDCCHFTINQRGEIIDCDPKNGNCENC
ncbi:MAG: RNA polymerase sigma factor SigZ [Candidatus Thiodiazotropha endolucinida]